MNAIEQFIQRFIVVGTQYKQPCADVVARYVKFNNGSTTGKMKLYAHLQELNNVSKNRTHFIGLKLAEDKPEVIKNIPADIDYKMMKLSLIEKCAKEKLETKLKIETEKAQMEAQRIKMEAEKAEREERMAIEKAKMEAEKAEREERMAIEKAKMEAEKAEREERIALERLKLEAERVRIEAEKIASNERICQMNIKKDMDIIEIKMADNEKHRTWMESENNKNRLMTSMTRFNEYLDPRIYGTPSQQYITIESLQKTLQFRSFVATRKLQSEVVSNAIQSNPELIENIEVKENKTVKNVDAIRTERISEIIKDITDKHDEKKKIEYVMKPLSTKLQEFKQETKDGDKRTMNTMYEDQINENICKTKKTLSDKLHLAETSEMCNMSKQDGKIVVNCFCCDMAIPLLDSMCQRGHNLPKSKGGSNMDYNIELICSNCNISMGDHKTIYEYLASIYDVQLKADASKIDTNDTK